MAVSHGSLHALHVKQLPDLLNNVVMSRFTVKPSVEVLT